ncbi:penicillin-binding protein 2 [Patescibacteria group bacterium]|nr:penicillin-binding protein 2 [Patescibacteria group bacterium]
MYKRSASRQNFNIKADRLTILSAAFFLLTALIVVKLLKLQVIDHSLYLDIAQQQHFATDELMPERGGIFIHDYQSGQEKLYPVALNRKNYLVYAVPNEVDDAANYAKILAPVLEMEGEVLFDRLFKENDIYEPLKHHLDEEKRQEIEDLNLDGIRFEEEVVRYYPEENIGSHVLGFVGYDGDRLIGRYGVEGYWEEELAGQKGSFLFERDASGRLIPIAQRIKAEEKNGTDIILTLDRSIQFTACSALQTTVLRHGADNGSVIIINPATGAILAMCNYPDFDPNKYNEVEDISVYNNLAIFEAYEPGSIMKGITMAMALDTGKVTPATTYEDTGSVEISGYTIRNSDEQAHGIKTMTEVLEESLNTGAIFVARTVGQELFQQYYKNFGFGQLTNIQTETENPGDIKSLGYPNEIFMATASFGQGITVTPLQITAAFSAIANKGKLMKPYIVDEIRYPDGKVEKIKPQFIRQVVTQQTAITLSAMLASVVKYGHAQQAGVPGYYIAGKTGTAQVADPYTGGYSADKTIHSFVGFAPVDNPRYVMLIKLDHPRGVRFAASSVAPLFGELSQFLLNYFHVPPSYKINDSDK